MVLFAMFGMTGCDKVPSGYVGVKVNLLGGEKGVDVQPLGVGRYWIGVNEDLFLFPTFTQNYVWTADVREGSETDESISFQTVEGLTVNTDVGITYTIDPDKVTEVFQKYRKGVTEITDIYLRNIVRDEMNRSSSMMKVDAAYGAGKAELMSKTLKAVQDKVGPSGIKVESIYLVSDLRLPPNIVDSINLKIAATQKAEQRNNEIATAEAQAKVIEAEASGKAKAILVEAQAQAEANRLLAQSMSGVLVQYKAIEKWDGQMPKISGSNGTMVQVDKMLEAAPVQPQQ